MCESNREITLQGLYTEDLRQIITFHHLENHWYLQLNHFLNLIQVILRYQSHIFCKLADIYISFAEAHVFFKLLAKEPDLYDLRWRLRLKKG